MHFVGLKAVGESCEQPLMYYHNNVYGILMSIQVMADAGVKQLAFRSSATVYGVTEHVPYKASVFLPKAMNCLRVSLR